MISFLVLVWFVAYCRGLALPQGPNTEAASNPNIRTASANGTWVIVPINATVLQAEVPYPLLPLPTQDKSLFPQGFPEGFHPILCWIGYENDIRMIILQIQSLMGGNINIPYVDRLADGQTPFNYPFRNWIGGTNGNSLQALVPTEVGTLEGTPINEATFYPDTAAYLQIGPDEYVAQCKQIVVPNTLSGPGIYLEAIDFDFVSADQSTLPFNSHTFHTFISQPQILDNGMCQRNPVYFNWTFSAPTFRRVNTTLYPLTDTTALAGEYDGMAGYSANGVMIGYNAESCASAANLTDPNALA